MVIINRITILYQLFTMGQQITLFDNSGKIIGNYNVELDQVVGLVLDLAKRYNVDKIYFLGDSEFIQLQKMEIEAKLDNKEIKLIV